jgi:hypothetical protein
LPILSKNLGKIFAIFSKNRKKDFYAFRKKRIRSMIINVLTISGSGMGAPEGSADAVELQP